MQATINYTLPSGKKAVITVAPSKNWDGTISASIQATVEGIGGMTQMNWGVPSGLPVWAVSAIGKLALTAAADAQVAAAVAAIDAAHTKHNALAAAHIAELESISDSSRRIARRMAC
jgi:hypothetical protein